MPGNRWLGLFGPEAISMRVKGGTPHAAFNALVIQMAHDHHEIDWAELSFELRTELGSTTIAASDSSSKSSTANLKNIADLLALVKDGLYLLAWGGKKPSTKHGTEHSFMPIKRKGPGWAMCSRRPPYHPLLEFATADDLAQGILRRMRAA